MELNAYSTADEVYIPSFEDEWLANDWVIEYSKGKDNGILPIAAIATRNNPQYKPNWAFFYKSPQENSD